MELLLPMAAQKLDLSFNIDPEVPACKVFHLLGLTQVITRRDYIGIFADYARIRQGVSNCSL